MMRIIVHLSNIEFTALLKLAEVEYRHPRAQAAVLIRAELERRGLLAADPPAPAEAANPQQEADDEPRA